MGTNRIGYVQRVGQYGSVLIRNIAGDARRFGYDGATGGCTLPLVPSEYVT